ncbi:hypothetical protein BDAP_002554 [Binucleata daphniae]
MKKRSILEFLSSPYKQQNTTNEDTTTVENNKQIQNKTPEKQNIKTKIAYNNNSLRKSIIEDEISDIQNEVLDEIFEERKENNKMEMNESKRIKANNTKLKNDEKNKKEVHNTAKKPKEETRFDFLVNLQDKNQNEFTSDFYDPSSLFISENDYKKFTPFEKQFWDIKKEYFDTIIFFKKGKFYELYENDADIANKEFGLRITERVNMRMAGVPESSFDLWSAKFLEKGYKIGRVDQAENAIARNLREKDEKQKNINENDSVTKKQKKSEVGTDKILKRELKEIITPGTIYNYEHIKDAISVYIAVLIVKNEDTNFHIILYDASINELMYDSFTCKTRLYTILAQFRVLEIITDCNLKFDNHIKVIKPIKGGSAIKFRECFSNEQEYIAFLMLKNYMSYLYRDNFTENINVKKIQNRSNMILDSITLKNLEIFENTNDKTEKNTLFNAINFCTTNSGQRKLKNWVLCPLMNIKEIKKRQEISTIFENIDISKIRDIMKEIGDIERIMNSLFGENPVIKDLIKFKNDIELFIKVIYNLEVVYKQNYNKSYEEYKIRRNFSNDKRNNNVFFDTFYVNFPDLQRIIDDFNTNYEIQENEIETLNDNHPIQRHIQNLKEIETNLIRYLESQKIVLKEKNIGYKDIGKEIYQIEVPLKTIVPDDYMLVSNTKNSKRYYTKEIKSMVSEYVEYEERLFQSRGRLLREVANELKQNLNEYYKAVNIISEIDCYVSFCTYNKYNEGEYPEYYAEEIDNDDERKNYGHNSTDSNFNESSISDNKGRLLSFTALTNPIYKNYVENDLQMTNTLLILTGPNMGGKSTFLRTIALNIILGQIGLKIKCKKYKSIIFDRIFTRIGASDNLIKGESTFAVELKETSVILNECTNKSFVIFDELGRGTSTKDGECIARSVIEYIKKKEVHCVFSTHYSEMVKGIENVMKGYMKVLCDKDFVFLYKLGFGVCEESHGIEIAKFAGVNKEIIRRAIEIKNKLLSKENKAMQHK